MNKRSIAVLIISVIICVLVGCGNSSTYDYQEDKIKGSIDYRSEEDQDFSQVKSSSAYNLKAFSLRPGESDLQKQLSDLPFSIVNLEYKDNGLLIGLEFKDSGFIKNFKMSIKADNQIRILRQDIVDCSNQINFYLSDFITDYNSFKPIRFLDFSWETANVDVIGDFDFSKESEANQAIHFSQDPENTHITNCGNGTYKITHPNIPKLELNKSAYNSLSLKSHRGLITFLKSFRQDNKAKKLYVIASAQHAQTNSYGFSKYKRINTLLQSNNKIDQLKICIEREEN